MIDETQWREVAWESAEDSVAAGGLCDIKIEDDFRTALIEVVYNDVYFRLDCIECSYLTLRNRSFDFGCAVILEAYIHTASPLIDQLRTHQLESKAGSLALEDRLNRPYLTVHHLEIVGEVSLDILCERIKVYQCSSTVSVLGPT